jgi:hypothetical protein
LDFLDFCSQCVPIMFPVNLQCVFQVPNMFPIAPYFYAILFFSFGEGGGSWIFVVHNVFPLYLQLVPQVLKMFPIAFHFYPISVVEKCDLVTYIGWA